jgi:hypothetical protein
MLASPTCDTQLITDIAIFSQTGAYPLRWLSLFGEDIFLPSLLSTRWLCSRQSRHSENP